MGLPKGNQIAAARALLGWDQRDVAERVGLTIAAISKIEKGENKGKTSTLEKIQSAFELGGVVFTKDGVELKNDTVTIIEGEGWYLRLLDDVYYTLNKGGELLVDMADDTKSPPQVIEMYRRLRGSGVSMRQTVEEGNTYLMGPVGEYRWIPHNRYKNWVTLIYGNKVAVSIDGETKCLLFRDGDLAKAEKNKFDLIWDLLPELTIESGSNVRF